MLVHYLYGYIRDAYRLVTLRSPQLSVIPGTNKSMNHYSQNASSNCPGILTTQSISLPKRQLYPRLIHHQTYASRYWFAHSRIQHMLNPACVTLALVLPQHILTNPLHAPRRQSPFATLFAFDTRFVDESVIARQPTSHFLLYPPPKRPWRHNPIPRAFPPPISFISQRPRYQSHCVSYRKGCMSCRHRVVEQCQVVGTYSCMNNA